MIVGKVFCGVKLVNDVEEMAQLAHDLAKLHNLHGTHRSVEEVYSAADYAETIRYHVTTLKGR